MDAVKELEAYCKGGGVMFGPDPADIRAVLSRLDAAEGHLRAVCDAVESHADCGTSNTRAALKYRLTTARAFLAENEEAGA